MSFTLYDSSIAIALKALASLKEVLQKAQGVPNSSALIEAKIHPDMLDMAFQVNLTTATAAKMHARAMGVEPPPLDGALKTFDDFFARIQEVTTLLASADKELINSRANELVPVGMGPGKTVQMPLSAYVTGYSLPNIFFHLTTAYNICRKNDVELGKLNFLRSFLGDYAPQ